MDHIQLTDALKTGHVQIDTEHQELIGILNNCIDLVDRSGSVDAVRVTLMELQTRLKQHIVDEEDIMAQLGFTDLEMEREEHARGLKELQKLLDTCQQGVGLETLVKDVSALIIEIFIKSDVGLKGYLQGIGYR